MEGMRLAFILHVELSLNVEYQTKLEIIQEPRVSIFEFGPCSPSLDVIRAEIWAGEIIHTRVAPVSHCHNNQSVRKAPYHTAQGILSSSFELISRQTNSFASLLSWQRRKDQNCNNACGIIWGELKCAQLNQVRRGHGVLDVILERNMGRWLGRRHSGYMIRPDKP